MLKDSSIVSQLYNEMVYCVNVQVTPLVKYSILGECYCWVVVTICWFFLVKPQLFKHSLHPNCLTLFSSCYILCILKSGNRLFLGIPWNLIPEKKKINWCALLVINATCIKWCALLVVNLGWYIHYFCKVPPHTSSSLKYTLDCTICNTFILFYTSTCSFFTCVILTISRGHISYDVFLCLSHHWN